MPWSDFALRAGVAALCVVGLYVSWFMLRKYLMAQRGELREPSVVQSSRARIGRIPNARSGIIYYALMLALAPLLSPAHPLAVHAALAAAVVAALVSLYLAYSLLFVTRMPCTYCWTGHIINWALLALLIVAERSPPR